MHLGAVKVSRLRPIGRRVRAPHACRDACFVPCVTLRAFLSCESGLSVTAWCQAIVLPLKHQYSQRVAPRRREPVSQTASRLERVELPVISCVRSLGLTEMRERAHYDRTVSDQ